MLRALQRRRGLIATGVLGGGGLPAPSVFPNNIAGLTEWGKADDISTLYQDSGATTPVALDGDPVGYVGDKSGAGNHLKQTTTGNKASYKTNIQNGKAAILADGTDDFLISSVNLTSLMTVSAYTILFVAKPVILDTNLDPINTYNNDCFFSDSNSVFNIHARSTQNFYVSNYDGTYDIQGVALDGLNTFIGSAWHSGGNLYIARNDGTPVSVASGNSTNFATLFRMFSNFNGTVFINSYMMEYCVWNVAISDLDRANMLYYLNYEWKVY